VTRHEHAGNARTANLVVELSATGLVIDADDLSNWPTGAVGTFYATLNKGQVTEEKVLCSGRTGNSVQVFTDVSGNGRGADDTVAQVHPINSTIEHSWTAIEADEANAHLQLTNGAHGYPPIANLLTTSSVIPQAQVEDLEVDLAGKANLAGAVFTGEVDVVSATAVGSSSARQVFMSTADPAPADGADGDMWVKFIP
jgi:hypothetical protein